MTANSSPIALNVTHLIIEQILKAPSPPRPAKLARYREFESCLQEYLEPAIHSFRNIKSVS